MLVIINVGVVFSGLKCLGYDIPIAQDAKAKLTLASSKVLDLNTSCDRAS